MLDLARGPFALVKASLLSSSIALGHVSPQLLGGHCEWLRHVRHGATVLVLGRWSLCFIIQSEPDLLNCTFRVLLINGEVCPLQHEGVSHASSCALAFADQTVRAESIQLIRLCFRFIVGVLLAQFIILWQTLERLPAPQPCPV